MRTLVLMLTAPLVLGGPAMAAEPAFEEITEVVVVEVPVQVSREGEPVRGLTADDFEVYDGRRQQALTGFEVVDLGAADAETLPAVELPPSARRHFLILFDLSFSSLQGLGRAREAALEMVEALHPADLVAVGSWSNRWGAQLIQGFTADRQLIAAALGSLGTSEMLDTLPPDPLRMAVEEGASTRGGSRRAGRMGALNREEVEAEADEILIRIAQQAEQARLLEVSRAVQHMSLSMAGFAHVMNGIEGRKHVVWLSEGFEPAALTGGPQGSRPLNAVERMLEELRRVECAVQVVDIAGLRGQGALGGARVAGHEVLLNFAKGTGGELYEKTNDLGGALRQMLRRTGVTYVLSFQPEKVGDPGTFHRLRVKLKDQPRGTRVTHRPGWYAPRPYKRIKEEAR